MTKIKIGSDFSGVGAFNQSLIRLGIEYDELFACDMDKYARQTFELNYGTPRYFPKDVYEREIPKESLDVYMTSPPCQSFSLAGKRLGKEDKRGILFFNSLEFIQKNKPRYFIFENVKGLLSHDKVDPKAEYGRTFQEWINYLGGKSVNGLHTFFPCDDSVPYHIYYQVLNAKHYGIPQNRERIFIIGIRDDEDNNFVFPKPFPLEKRLKDVLEYQVDEKYFLSDKMLNYFDSRASNFNNGNINFKDEESVASTITSSSKSLDISDNIIRLANVNPSGNGMNGNVYSDEGVSPTLSTNKGEGIKIGAIRGRNPQNPKSRKSGLETEQMLEINENGTSNTLTTVQKDNVVVIPTNNSKGFDIAEEEEEDSINFSNPNSETRRGRVGKKVSQTLDTQCNQGVYSQQRIRRLLPIECFKLMDFNFGIPGVKDFVWDVSDSQAYKQAGNSICVGVLVEIIKKLNLK
jgi:DNA (cytosine-5)-methyltransferase 1